MEANGLTDARELLAGEVLVVPTSPAIDRPLTYSRVPFLPGTGRLFAWPVDVGYVSSPFGMRNGVMHDGIDIAAGAGTPVHAAAEGTVIFSGRLRGYGNAIILRHLNGYVTVYGHNRRNLVSSGAYVMRGQAIAELGATGRTTGPNLHFEVRYHGQPQDPLSFLPPLQTDGTVKFARNSGW